MRKKLADSLELLTRLNLLGDKVSVTCLYLGQESLKIIAFSTNLMRLKIYVKS